MATVEFADSAQRDLLDIVDFISWDNERRALSFADELQDRIVRKLGTFPLSGVAIGNIGRRYSVFSNYVVVYEIDEAHDKVRIVLVTEGHRNWRPAFE
jgi:addiction module RelE/StbE family toxin